MARPKSKTKRPAPPADKSKQQGAIKVESSGRKNIDPKTARFKNVTVLKSHTYNSARRESTGWVELGGSKVPVDQAVTHQNIAVHMSLFFDIIAVDATTKKNLWDLDWRKTQPFWQTVSIVELPLNGKKILAVELFAANSKTGELIYQYHDAKTGERIEPDKEMAAWNPGQRVPIAIAGSFGIKNESDLLDSIHALGGTVVAKYDQSGNLSGKIDSKTRYLLLGNPPDEDDEDKVKKAYQSLISQAQSHSVPVMTLDKLKSMAIDLNHQESMPEASSSNSFSARDPIKPKRNPATSRDNHPNIRIAKKNGETITQAYSQATGRKRSPAELLIHLSQYLDLKKPIENGEMCTNMNTLVSAHPRYLLGIGMDADEVTFFLPTGSSTQARYTGKKIEINKNGEVVQVIITHGELQLLDANGVARAIASADGGAEQLVVTAKNHVDGIELVMKTRRLVEDKDFPNPPVQVKFNTETGADENESDIPHKAVRFSIQPEDKDKPARLKLVRHYNLKRLATEAEEQTGKNWQELIENSKPNAEKPAEDLKLLSKHWVHSREEQGQDGIQIYRPEGSHVFPPSRFRMQYILKGDGSCRYLYLSPSDRHHFRDGTWKMKDKILEINRGGEKSRFEIIELTNGVLRVKAIDN